MPANEVTSGALSRSEVSEAHGPLAASLAPTNKLQTCLESPGNFTLAPDWVCEVLSPATARLDRLKKLAIYAREGVGHAWLVDPGLETLEVYRTQDEAWLLVLTAGGDDVVRAEPFDAVELTLTGLWIRPA